MTVRSRHILAFTMGISAPMIFGLLGLIFATHTAMPVTLKLLSASIAFSVLALFFWHPSRHFPNSSILARISAALVYAGFAISLAQTFYPADWWSSAFYVAFAAVTACICYFSLHVVSVEYFEPDRQVKKTCRQH